MATPYRRPISVVAAVALAVSSATSGCSNLPISIPGLSGQNLTVDPNDACGPERAAFAKSNDFFTADVLKSAGIAALVGAGGGAALGGALGGGRGAVQGALLGGVFAAGASLFASYASYMQQHYTSSTALANGIDSDLRTESRAMDTTTADFRNLRNCRFAQAALIKREYARGEISRAEAEHQLGQQRAWFSQEIAQAQNWGVNMEKRDQQYQQATELLEQKAPPRTSHPVVVAATETIPDKREAFQSSVGQAQTESELAFNVDQPP